MHPAVLAFWLASPRAVGGDQDAWDRQRAEVFGAALDGHWWGTITSEPGSGGDIAKTKTLAKLDGSGGYLLSGQKHFGSGSGISSFMITTAVPEGETGPELFYFDARRAWDGSDGMKLIAEWDGHGMAATQSHAFQFDGVPVVRCAWRGGLQPVLQASFGFVGCLFAAVIVGICDAAFENAREALRGKEASMRPYERIEWARAEMEHWLIQQAYEGMVRAVETGPEGQTPLGVLQGKTAIAELAETRHGPRLQGHRRRHLPPPLASRQLVRGRARAWLPAPAVGAGVRPHGRRLARSAGIVPGDRPPVARSQPDCMPASRRVMMASASAITRSMSSLTVGTSWISPATMPHDQAPAVTSPSCITRG